MSLIDEDDYFYCDVFSSTVIFVWCMDVVGTIFEMDMIC